MGAVRLSVIIPVKQDARLAGCLAALATQTFDRSQFEIIVVDNGPDPSAGSLARLASARYLVHLDGGSYSARARGTGEAHGNILVFTDADCVPARSWLATISRIFDDPLCQVVIGPSESTEASVLSSWVQDIDESRWQIASKMDRTAYCDTRNLAIRREVLDQIPFDPAFLHAGDLDLGLRLYEAGIHIRTEPSLRIRHDHPRSLRALLRRGMRRGRGLAQLERKHGVFLGPIAERPLVVAGWDLKSTVLNWGRRPVGRALIIGVVVASLAPLTGALFALARIPGANALGADLFVTFERLTLLLGRMLGATGATRMRGP
ncbi:MAG: glycosyltransferase [Dehalococcoidia bacterium]